MDVSLEQSLYFQIVNINILTVNFVNNTLKMHTIDNRLKEPHMKLKTFLLFLTVVLVLAGCGQGELKEEVALQNQSGEEVVFPTGEPVAFFFITSYT